MGRVVIPGGSGFLGRALAARLVARGDEVVILSRGEGRPVDGARTVVWDAASLGPWADELDGASAVVHLNGRRVDVRATRRNIDELISSRVQPVRVVGEAIARCTNPPPVWVQSSSLAVFGDGGDEVLDERSTPSGIGPREMVTVCLAWEGAFHQASSSVERTVLLRMGIGLGGRDDPATAKLAQLVRFGLGGRVGSGRQWVSWVGLDDLLATMLLSIDDPTMTGTYHVTSPNPVTNAEMMATYRRLLGRRVGLPSPAWLARIGAPILGSSASLALTGRRVVPTRLLERGFTFRQPDFEPAVRTALEACSLLSAVSATG
ncbi:MAG: TIGR01777 family oxidoreductase [Ilumatobacteraceae bacterium]